MTQTWWSDEPPPEPAAIGVAGWVRILLRGTGIGFVTFGALAILLVVRLIERPLFGQRRPWTPRITVAVCRTNLRLMGLTLRREGSFVGRPHLIVANHVSWLDIFVLNAVMRITFVAKSEVANWPGIGWLARATGTLFVRRDPRDAAAQLAQVGAYLRQDADPLLIFPEGTSSDGRRVLPFKPTLLAAVFDSGLSDARVLPLTIVYTAPTGAAARFYGWWGDMSFGGNLLQVLATPRQGRVTVIAHPTVRTSDYADRKALTRDVEATIRSALTKALDD